MNKASLVNRAYTYRKILERLYPNATGEQIDRAVLDKSLKGANLFFQDKGFLPVYNAFVKKDGGLLITNGARLKEVSNPKDFVPVDAIQSNSMRAWFIVDDQGELLEYKGLTPVKGEDASSPLQYNFSRINRNSNQPYWLFYSEAAIVEDKGLKIIDGIESHVTLLGDYFNDLDQFAQLIRKSKPNQKYLPWLRMHSRYAIFELLAELDGKSFEEFIYSSGFRMGSQLKKLHSAGMTMHLPWGDGQQPEPYFSTFHSGNVDPFGNIVDLEGAVPIDAAVDAFYQGLSANINMTNRKDRYLDKKFLNQIQQKDFIPRISDLNRVIAGREGALRPELSLFFNFYFENKSTHTFLCLMKGILNGYYYDNQSSNKNLLIKHALTDIDHSLPEVEDSSLPIGFVWQIFSNIEQYLK